MDPMTLNSVEVKSKGKIIHCRLIFKEDGRENLVIEIPLPVAVDLHRKIDVSILKILEDYTRL